MVHATAPRRLEGDGRVQRVLLRGNDGRTTIDCDSRSCAISSRTVGWRTRTSSAARRSPRRRRSSSTTTAAPRPDVYAAGDCAAVFDPLFGKHRVLDHWDNAVVTGGLAGRNMAGANPATTR